MFNAFILATLLQNTAVSYDVNAHYTQSHNILSYNGKLFLQYKF